MIFSLALTFPIVPLTQSTLINYRVVSNIGLITPAHELPLFCKDSEQNSLILLRMTCESSPDLMGLLLLFRCHILPFAKDRPVTSAFSLFQWKFCCLHLLWGIISRTILLPNGYLLFTLNTVCSSHPISLFSPAILPGSIPCILCSTHHQHFAMTIYFIYLLEEGPLVGFRPPS